MDCNRFVHNDFSAEWNFRKKKIVRDGTRVKVCWKVINIYSMQIISYISIEMQYLIVISFN